MISVSRLDMLCARGILVMLCFNPHNSTSSPSWCLIFICATTLCCVFFTSKFMVQFLLLLCVGGYKSSSISIPVVFWFSFNFSVLGEFLCGTKKRHSEDQKKEQLIMIIYASMFLLPTMSSFMYIFCIHLLSYFTSSSIPTPPFPSFTQHLKGKLRGGGGGKVEKKERILWSNVENRGKKTNKRKVR